MKPQWWVKSSEHKERLFKMKITGFLGHVRINFCAFCFRASEVFGLEKMKRGGKRISI